MKLITLLLLCALGCPPASHAQAAAGEGGGRATLKQSVPKAGLELTTSTVEEVSCHPDHLSHALRLTYRNVGDVPIILDRRSTAVARTLVSRSHKDAEAQKYEVDSRRAHFTTAALGFSIEPPADMSNFIVIGPGETYTPDGPLPRVSHWMSDGAPDTDGRLRPGTYFLQIRVYTWYYPPKAADDLREKWRDRGFLWSETLTSRPTPFKLERNRPVSKCPTTPTARP